ncbi:hypothetical protein SBADM41S_00223 [Streptomyces badius]
MRTACDVGRAAFPSATDASAVFCSTSVVAKGLTSKGRDRWT